MTIEQLAEKIGGNLWTKGSLKRIYLDRGYNTKKMQTKTFIWQNEDGEFLVSCRIECPSQPYEWINSQQEIVKESVYEDLEKILSEKAFVITNEKGEVCDDSGNSVELNHYSVKVFYSKEKAEEYIDEEESVNLSYKEFDKEWLEQEVDRLDEIERANKNSQNIEQ